ncbi:rRNA biogenesis protein rrp36 [Ceratobasidium sp. 370]|nr:rRNA biogenesis protein rrp36 [Ceratobasidium sp. 370]
MPRRPRPTSRPPPRSKRPHPDEEDEVDDIKEDRPRFAQWVPEDELDVSRDPRFTPLSGELSQSHIAKAYSFLPELQKSEAAALHASLAKARKQRAAPETIDKLERALKRAESAVERAKREEREREVLAKAKKEEEAKRKEGKRAWFLKKSEKRDLLLQAKFDDLAASGGQNAVRKAIDKRKKKLAQKEKKARPFSKAQARASTQRQDRGEGSGDGRKRRRM